jgi:hypothetical protein
VRERSCIGTRRRWRDCMLVHLLLHRHAGSGTVTKSDMPMSQPSGRLHRGFPRASAIRTIHGPVCHARMAPWTCPYAGRSDGGRSVRSSSLSVLHSGGAVRLPSEVERLLLEVVAEGLVLYCCGPRAAPFCFGRGLRVGGLRRSSHHPVLRPSRHGQGSRTAPWSGRRVYPRGRGVGL